MFFITAAFQSLAIVPIIERKKNVKRALDELKPMVERTRNFFEGTDRVEELARFNPQVRRMVDRFKAIEDEYLVFFY